jgi:DNA-binding SARP family transcriptional activator
LLGRGQRDHALAVLASAEAMYIGDFMEEFPYADWPISRREQARTEYLEVASHLAEADMSRGDHESAARRFLRMLERDPFDERAHLGVVTAMSALGRHGTARRLYGIYCSRMDELDVEPRAFPGVG